MDAAGQMIKDKRLEMGLTQTEFGKLIGVSKQQVMRYETKGIANMRVRRLVKVAQVCRCRIDDLVALPEPAERI